MRTRHIAPLILLLLVPGWAAAQTSSPAVPAQFQILILPPSGDPLLATPITSQTTSIGPTQNCGIEPGTVGPPPPSPVVNPLLFVLNDPFTPNKLCRLSFPQNLIAGSYQWAGVFIAASCNPTGSQVVSPCPGPRTVGQPPFSVANLLLPPAAPTGLTFTQ